MLVALKTSERGYVLFQRAQQPCIARHSLRVLSLRQRRPYGQHAANDSLRHDTETLAPSPPCGLLSCRRRCKAELLAGHLALSLGAMLELTCALTGSTAVSRRLRNDPATSLLSALGPSSGLPTAPGDNEPSAAPLSDGTGIVAQPVPGPLSSATRGPVGDRDSYGNFVLGLPFWDGTLCPRPLLPPHERWINMPGSGFERISDCSSAAGLEATSGADATQQPRTATALLDKPPVLERLLAHMSIKESFQRTALSQLWATLQTANSVQGSASGQHHPGPECGT